MVRKLSDAASAATLALCLFPSVASAQATTTASQDDEIVVTAQRRAERLQDVPIAMNALSAQTISENNVRTIEDLAAITPGLVTTNNVNYGSAPISIRGIGGANGGGNVFADEPVAVYVDQAVVSRQLISTSDFVDVGSVEVLRGPQGTLYGRNSTGGAILIHSAAPTSTFEGYLDATAADPMQWRVQGAVSGPIAMDGALMGRLAVGLSERDGWAKNAAGGDNLASGDATTVRGYLRYEPTAALTIDFIGEYVDTTVRPATINVSDVSNLRDEVTNPAGTNVVRPYVPRPGLDALVDNNQFALNFPTFTDTRGYSGTATVHWDLGAVAFDSISNYREWTLAASQDSDGVAVNPPLPNFVTGSDPTNLGDNASSIYDNQWSQEFRLSSDGDGPFRWLVGAYLFTEKTKLAPIAIANSLAGPGGAGTLASFNARHSTNAWALFADTTWSFTDQLSLTLGARYSHEEKDFENHQLVTTIRQFDPPGPTFFPAGFPLLVLNANLSDSWNNFSPRVVLQYQPTRDFNAYVSYSQGFKSGGFNAFNASPASTSFQQERIDAIEVGVKSEWFDGQFMLNIALFDYDYGDLQVRVPVATGGVGIETVDSAFSRGFEIESTWRITHALTLSGHVARLDAEFENGSLSALCGGAVCTETPSSVSWVFGANPVVGRQNVAGNRLSRAPEWQYSLDGRYEWDTSIGRAAALLSYRGQTEVFFLETQQWAPTFRGERWDEVNARLSLTSPDNNWEAALFAKNLTDDRHFSQVTAFFGLPNGALNDPRTIGVQLRHNF